MTQMEVGKHRVTVRSVTPRLGVTPSLRTLMRRAAIQALKLLDVDKPCEIGVECMDEAHIRKLNRQFREIDKATDVLSFPNYNLRPGEPLSMQDEDGFPLALEGAQLYLGDIAVSFPRACAQAEAYGHSVSRELGFLVVHGVLHLLGYDHESSAEEEQMHALCERVLSSLGLERAP